MVSLNAWLPALAIGALTGVVTLAGGFAVLRLRSSLSLFLALSAGALVGVALFDLLPEAMASAGEAGARRVAAAVGAGFGFYLVLDRLPGLIGRGGAKSVTGPASLTLHSLLDGFGIGVAFHASLAAGWIVAVAVLAHDLVDGANTVTLSLRAGGSAPRAMRWLLADAAAPLVGIALAAVTPAPPAWLGVLLGLFCGFFLYIGAAELLPRSQEERPRASTLIASLATMALMYAIARLAVV